MRLLYEGVQDGVELGDLGLERQGASSEEAQRQFGAGAGIAAASQGSRNGYRYTVRTSAGSTIAIVSDQSEIRTGDCVVVEESGTTANIRRASSVLCQPQSAPAVALPLATCVPAPGV